MAYELKCTAQALAGSVYNEAFCLALAMVMGLRPAVAKVHVVEGRALLLVERYDRITDAKGPSRQLNQWSKHVCWKWPGSFPPWRAGSRQMLRLAMPAMHWLRGSLR